MAASGKVVWGGRATSVLVSLIFVIRALMKLVGGAEVKEGIKHLGLPESMRTPLSILDLACAVHTLASQEKVRPPTEGQVGSGVPAPQGTACAGTPAGAVNV